jgi:hypothetical protein
LTESGIFAMLGVVLGKEKTGTMFRLPDISGGAPQNPSHLEM